MSDLQLKTGVGGLPAAPNALADADLLIIGQSGGTAVTGYSYRTTLGAVRTALGTTYVAKTGDIMTGGLMINSNVTPLAMPANVQLYLLGLDGQNSNFLTDTFGAPPLVQYRRANGTLAAKTPILSGDLMVQLGGAGYTNAAAYSGNAAAIRLAAAEDFTGTGNGSVIQFRTTAIGSLTAANRWSVLDDGSFTANGLTKQGIGTVNATALYEAGVALTAKYAQLAVSPTFTGTTFTINRNSTTVASPSTSDPLLQVIGSDGFAARMDIACSQGSTFGGRRYNGVLSGTPTGVVAGDVLCIFGGGGYGASAFIAGYPAQFRIVGDGTWTNSSAPTRLEIRNTRSGSITNTIDWTYGADGCMFYGAGSTTGVAQTINAAALYEAGVALTSKYARLASANIFTAAQTINAGSGLGPGVSGLTLRSDSGGNFGAVLVTYHNTASPAVSDIPFIQQIYGKNSSAADYAFAQFFVTLDNVTAGAEAGHYQYQISIGGSIQNVLSIGNGVYTDLLTGQGNGTINAGRLYQNNIPIDSSTTVNTDADFTVIVGTSSRHQQHTGTLTANRTVTLSVSGVTVGDDFTFARVGAGAFNLSIGGLKNLVQNTWCKVKYTAAGWTLIAYGAL